METPTRDSSTTNARVRRSLEHLLLGALVIMSVVMTAVAGLSPEWRLVAVPLHAAIEALGGQSAGVIALFLLQRQGSDRRLPLAMGFLGMGLLDTFHAISAPGDGFVLLHTVAGLAGGVCFALLWLPDRWIRHGAIHKGWLTGAIGIGATALWAWTLIARHDLPAMTRGDDFSAMAVGLNLLAGGLFLGGAARLLLDFHRSGSFETYLLAWMATMFGLAGLLVSYSALWDPTWWLWHLVRATAYGFALMFAFREYHGTLTDLRRLVAEQRAAEARLRNSELRYRTLFEQSPEGVVLIDPRTALPIEFNDRAAEQLGYSRDEFARLRISDYEAAETAEQTAKHINAILKAGSDSFETGHRTKQGAIRTVLVSVQSIELSGQPVFHCIFRDITEVHEQASLARLGQMAAVVAHEVKNPLAAVRGAIQIIGRRLPPGSQDAAIVGEIVARIDALDELMKDLLLFARPPQVRPEPIDLVALARETSLLLSKDPAASDVCVEVEGSAPVVMVDAKLLSTVLLNLLLNAAHAMQRQGTIRISVATDHLACRIAVADTGPGIPPDIRDRIFTPFFTTKPRGTGLGLPTAKRLVEAHHGRLSVACPPDGGTIVTIELPRMAAGMDAHAGLESTAGRQA